MSKLVKLLLIASFVVFTLPSFAQENASDSADIGSGTSDIGSGTADTGSGSDDKSSSESFGEHQEQLGPDHSDFFSDPGNAPIPGE
jgi:hypothetical protein